MPSSETWTLLTDLSLPGVETQSDVLIKGESIADIQACGSIEVPPGTRTWSGKGSLALPGLVEPHVHLDKTYSHEVYLDHGSTGKGALSDAIMAMKTYKEERSIGDVLTRTTRAIERSIARGVTFIRSHVDIGEDRDLDILRAMVDLKHRMANRIDIEFTVLASAATQTDRDRIRKALHIGADAIGGAPALEQQPTESLKHCVEMAIDEGCRIDLHIDENENPASPCLRELAAICQQLKPEVSVTASHCCSLAFMEADERSQILDQAIAADIGFITLPACNLVLMGRDQWPRPRGVPPVKEITTRGGTVAVGTDNVQDPFQPWGDYDPLQQASLLGHIQQFDGGETSNLLKMCTGAAAELMGQTNYGLSAGKEANLVVLDCNNEHAALCEAPARQLVLHKGEPAHTSPTFQWEHSL